MIPSSIKRLARLTLGEHGYNTIGNLYVRWQAGKDPQYKDSIQRILTLKDKHKGQRCFIIGNGPSLRNTDLTLLKNEITFGLNRIYLLFGQMGFTTSYFVSINRLVIEQCAQVFAGKKFEFGCAIRCRAYLQGFGKFVDLEEGEQFVIGTFTIQLHLAVLVGCAECLDGGWAYVNCISV